MAIRKISNPKTLTRVEIIAYICSWTLPLISAIIPLAMDQYQYLGSWCWITSNGTGNILRFAVFYIPLFIVSYPFNFGN